MTRVAASPTVLPLFWEKVRHTPAKMKGMWRKGVLASTWMWSTMVTAVPRVMDTKLAAASPRPRFWNRSISRKSTLPQTQPARALRHMAGTSRTCPPMPKKMARQTNITQGTPKAVKP